MFADCHLDLLWYKHIVHSNSKLMQFTLIWYLIKVYITYNTHRVVLISEFSFNYCYHICIMSNKWWNVGILYLRFTFYAGAILQVKCKKLKIKYKNIIQTCNSKLTGSWLPLVLVKEKVNQGRSMSVINTTNHNEKSLRKFSLLTEVDICYKKWYCKSRK